MANELKPCPFCGASSDEIMIFADPTEATDNSGPSRRVQCACCNIEAPFYPSEAEAIAAWNTRPAAPVERLETLGGINLASGEFIPVKSFNGANKLHIPMCNKETAEAIIAVERAEKDAWMKSAIDQQKQAKRLKEHNAVQVARIKELKETVRDLENLREGERETMKALEDKLEAAEKALEAKP